MSRGIFHPESGLMLTMANITDCIFLSLFWLVGCIPVVTIGASCAALYDASYRAYREGEKNSWQRFFRVYRENLKAAMVPNLVVLAVFLAGGWGMIQLWNAAVAGTVTWMVFAGLALVSVVIMGILSLVLPMLSRFENSTGVLLKNALFLGMANLPRTLALGILNTAVLLLCLVYILPVFLLPSLAALLGSFLIEPMFRPYMPQEEEME